MRIRVAQRRAVMAVMIVFGLVAAVFFASTELSVLSAYDITLDVKNAWAVGEKGIKYYYHDYKYAVNPWGPGGGGGGDEDNGGEESNNGETPESTEGGGLSSADITDGRAGDIPDIGISLQVPSGVKELGNITLHDENGEWIAYAWEAYFSVAITASPRYKWLGGVSWAYDKWAEITVLITLRSRLNYSIIGAWCTYLNVTGTKPGDLAASRNVWMWVARYDYRETTPYSPLLNAFVETEEKVDFVGDVREVLDAYDMRKGVTLRFSAKIVPTVIQSTLPLYDVYVAPVTLVWQVKIVFARAFKVTPMQPDIMPPIENPTIQVKPDQPAPWWAYWSVALVGLIAVVVIAGIVLVRSVSRAAARAARG